MAETITVPDHVNTIFFQGYRLRRRRDGRWRVELPMTAKGADVKVRGKWIGVDWAYSLDDLLQRMAREYAQSQGIFTEAEYYQLLKQELEEAIKAAS